MQFVHEVDGVDAELARGFDEFVFLFGQGVFVGNLLLGGNVFPLVAHIISVAYGGHFHGACPRRAGEGQVELDDGAVQSQRLVGEDQILLSQAGNLAVLRIGRQDAALKFAVRHKALVCPCQSPVEDGLSRRAGQGEFAGEYHFAVRHGHGALEVFRVLLCREQPGDEEE
jgi:hypothetical protein